MADAPRRDAEQSADLTPAKPCQLTGEVDRGLLLVTPAPPRERLVRDRRSLGSCSTSSPRGVWRVARAPGLARCTGGAPAGDSLSARAPPGTGPRRRARDGRDAS